MPTKDQPSGGRGDFVVTECLQWGGDIVNLAVATWLRGPHELALLWFRLGAESWRFASERLAAQAAFLTALSGCKDAEALALEEARFVDETAKALSSEVDRLSDVTHQVAELAGRRDAA